MKNSMLARKYFIQHMKGGVAGAWSTSPSLALHRRSESCNFMAQQPNIITCQTALITRLHLLRILLSLLPTGQRSGHSGHDALDYFRNTGRKREWFLDLVFSEQGGGARESYSSEPAAHSCGGETIMLWHWWLLLSTAPKRGSLGLQWIQLNIKHKACFLMVPLMQRWLLRFSLVSICLGV